MNKAATAAVHHHKATEAAHLPVLHNGERVAKEVKAVRGNNEF
jgi:hypothetical protein